MDEFFLFDLFQSISVAKSNEEIYFIVADSNKFEEKYNEVYLEILEYDYNSKLFRNFVIEKIFGFIDKIKYYELLLINTLDQIINDQDDIIVLVDKIVEIGENSNLEIPIIFAGYASEIDCYPLLKEKDNWNKDAFIKKRIELENYGIKIKKSALELRSKFE